MSVVIMMMMMLAIVIKMVMMIVMVIMMMVLTAVIKMMSVFMMVIKIMMMLMMVIKMMTTPVEVSDEWYEECWKCFSKLPTMMDWKGKTNSILGWPFLFSLQLEGARGGWSLADARRTPTAQTKETRLNHFNHQLREVVFCRRTTRLAALPPVHLTFHVIERLGQINAIKLWNSSPFHAWRAYGVER